MITRSKTLLICPDGFFENTGLTVTDGQHLTVTAWGAINLMDPDEWFGPDGNSSDVGVLKGKVGEEDEITFGVSYDGTYNGPTGVLTLGIDVEGENDDNPNNNLGFFNVNVIVDAPGEPNHGGTCDEGCYDGRVTSRNPLELDKGRQIRAHDLERCIGHLDRLGGHRHQGVGSG